MTKQFVVFCTPTLPRDLALEYTMSALATQDLVKSRGMDQTWRWVGGDPYLFKVRNRLASEFLNNFPDATDLFFIDADEGWPPEAVWRLLQYPHDVVAGVYPKKEDKLNFPCELLAPEGHLIERDGLYLAGMVPTGFLRIKRHVLEKLAEQSGWYIEEDASGEKVKCFDIFRNGFIPDNEEAYLKSFKADFDGDMEAARRGKAWGEDFFFCARWRMMGGEIWVDPNIPFTHAGRKVWFANFIDTVLAYQEEHPPSMKEPAITRTGSSAQLEDALKVALAEESGLPQEIMDMEGMSGIKYRHFISALMRGLFLPYPKYLEIGSWKGSTAIAACYGRGDSPICIDNWSEYGGTFDAFHANMTKWGQAYRLFNNDFREVDYAALPACDVFFYDGSHTYQDQHDAIVLAQPALADDHVLIVDDWNWPEVRNGTMDALRDIGAEIVASIEIRTPRNPAIGEKTDWHNGYLIAEIRKGKAQ